MHTINLDQWRGKPAFSKIMDVMMAAALISHPTQGPGDTAGHIEGFEKIMNSYSWVHPKIRK